MRIDQAIHNYNTPNLPDIEVTIVDSQEEVQHPERFNKILDSEEITDSGCKKRMYHLERKKQAY